MKVVRAWLGVLLISISAGLSYLSIQQISDISQYSYNSQNDIISIIKHFSIIISNLTKHSYNDLELEQMTIDIRANPKISVIRPRVVLKAIPLSNPVIILYNSLANIDLVTHLHLVDNQWMMLS